MSAVQCLIVFLKQCEKWLFFLRQAGRWKRAPQRRVEKMSRTRILIILVVSVWVTYGLPNIARSQGLSVSPRWWKKPQEKQTLAKLRKPSKLR